MAIVWLRKEQQFGGWKKIHHDKGKSLYSFCGDGHAGVDSEQERHRGCSGSVGAGNIEASIRKYCVYLTFMAIGIGTYLFFLKQGSALGRTFIWRLSLGMLTDNGWLGTGLGALLANMARCCKLSFPQRPYCLVCYECRCY